MRGIEARSLPVGLGTDWELGVEDGVRVGGK